MVDTKREVSILCIGVIIGFVGGLILIALIDGYNKPDEEYTNPNFIGSEKVMENNDLFNETKALLNYTKVHNQVYNQTPIWKDS